MLEFHPTVGSLASRVLEAVFIANHQMQLVDVFLACFADILYNAAAYHWRYV